MIGCQSARGLNPARQRGGEGVEFYEIRVSCLRDYLTQRIDRPGAETTNSTDRHNPAHLVYFPDDLSTYIIN
jgi:hypothetical protein